MLKHVVSPARLSPPVVPAAGPILATGPDRSWRRGRRRTRMEGRCPMPEPTAAAGDKGHRRPGVLGSSMPADTGPPLRWTAEFPVSGQSAFRAGGPGGTAGARRRVLLPVASPVAGRDGHCGSGTGRAGDVGSTACAAVQAVAEPGPVEHEVRKGLRRSSVGRRPVWGGGVGHGPDDGVREQRPEHGDLVVASLSARTPRPGSATSRQTEGPSVVTR